VAALSRSWPLVQEIASAENMFSGGLNGFGNRVEEIRLTFMEGAPEPDPEHPGWQRVTLSALDLQVDTRDASSGDPTLYITPTGGRVDLFFVRTDEEDPASHEKLWKIIEWHDRTSGLAKTQETTWSEIKAAWAPGPEPPYLPLTTIANVIHNLELSYELRDYLEYRRLFHPDYTFLPNPHDNVPPWGRAEELTSARRMLGGESNRDGYLAVEIRLAFAAGEPQSDPDSPDTLRVILSAVDLQVETRHEAMGDHTLYVTPAGTQEHLTFVLTSETDPGSGSPLWKILRWEDLGAGAARGVEPTSWGRVKTLFL
jgi:hypothetical protein